MQEAEQVRARELMAHEEVQEAVRNADELLAFLALAQATNLQGLTEAERLRVRELMRGKDGHAGGGGGGGGGGGSGGTGARGGAGSSGGLSGDAALAQVLLERGGHRPLEDAARAAFRSAIAVAGPMEISELLGAMIAVAAPFLMTESMRGRFAARLMVDLVQLVGPRRARELVDRTAADGEPER